MRPYKSHRSEEPLTSPTDPGPELPRLADGVWASCGIPYLMQHLPSGTYYVRKRMGSRTVQRSLGTALLSEAKACLPEKLIELRDEVEGPRKDVGRDLPRPPRGYEVRDDVLGQIPKSVNLDPNKATKWSEAAAIFLDELLTDPGLSESTKNHRSALIRQHLLLWDDLGPRRGTELPEDVLRKYFYKLAQTYSATHYNALRWAFRCVVKIMRDRDARLGLPLWDDPTVAVRRLGTRLRDVQLPSHEQFSALLTYLDGRAPRAAFSARLAAYTGVRWLEASQIRWGDVDLLSRQVKVWCVKRRRRSSHHNVYRHVPMIPDASAFFSHWSQALRPLPSDFVAPRGRIDAALQAATKALDLPPMRFHDLRHYFATRCIEAGVDIPTVSRWLGHTDGGALCLKVYGHLRTDHSQQAADRVKLQEHHACLVNVA